MIAPIAENVVCEWTQRMQWIMEKESVVLLGVSMGKMERILQNIIESCQTIYNLSEFLKNVSLVLYFQSGAYTKNCRSMWIHT